MDFSKPYEPTPSAHTNEPQADTRPNRKGPVQQVPALFRRKTA